MTRVSDAERTGEMERPDIALFGSVDADSLRRPDAQPDYMEIAESLEFQELRGTLRRFVFPMSLLFLVWYLTYVLVAAYEPGFMAIPVFGAVNLGFVMGIGQFASTIGITGLYLRFAARRIDPLVSELRQSVLGEDVPS
jgi:uncharacterized membrane protein (DUF485 family)